MAVKKKKAIKKKIVKKKLVKKTIDERQKSSDKAVPPAYFLSLSVENVRCFGPKQTIDVSDGKGRPAQWTVILGDNNTGKTTLLQCFVALEPFLFEKDFILSRLMFNLSKFDLSRNKRDELTISGIAFSLSKINQSTDGMKTEMMVRYHMSKNYRQETLGGLVCYGYGASRIMGESSLAEKTPGDPSAGLFEDDVKLINAEEWLLQADYAAIASKSPKLKEKAGDKRDQIRDVLINLLPEVDDIRVAEPTRDRPKPRVEFKTPYGWVALDGLSLGYRSMIAWMVDLANRMFERYPNSSNPLEEPAVVLVDEIDLHLHPKWQRILMDYLSVRFVNTQFIVTAHSPLVVQAAKKANVVLLKREDDHVVIDNNPQSVRGWRADQILTSLFELPSGYSVE